VRAESVPVVAVRSWPWYRCCCTGSTGGGNQSWESIGNLRGWKLKFSRNWSEIDWNLAHELETDWSQIELELVRGGDVSGQHSPATTSVRPSHCLA
jgi:hypothetical protein